MNHPPGHHLTDRQLVEPVLRGDRQAFNGIIVATEGLVAQIVFRLIPNEEDRKDVAQDIYLKVFHHLKGFKFESKLSTWIGQIAYNTCLNRLGKKQPDLCMVPVQDNAEEGRGGEVFLAADETDRELLQKELRVLIARELARLPPLYQTLIGLYHQQELSYQEIGLITGLPGGTVKSYLFRARKLLKETTLSHYKKGML
ncbi:MAG TPA: sigma-70 family RNA polymerase sigma factor [Puia sp.]|nr:sigma-70 family RNA polymerase sigma factor [Puia sp.]